MKIAVMSDIHSNVYALEAVLSDIKKRGVDATVNLGDILYGPIAPRATYEVLMEHEITTIQGNQDRQIYEAKADEISSNPTLQFILRELGREPLGWMASLPKTWQLNEQVFLCHGTPNDDLVYLLECVDRGCAAVRSDADIMALLGDQASKIILCGHTHIPRTVELSTGQLIVNPGSVGLPAYFDSEPVPHAMENYSSQASYALLQYHKTAWSIAHYKIEYDVEKAAKDAASRNRQDWVAYLMTGRAR